VKPDDRDVEAVRRENLYLHQRNAQLQSDVTSLSAETHRLRQEPERIHRRGALKPGNLLSAGQ
jgi:hypothetical protein